MRTDMLVLIGFFLVGAIIIVGFIWIVKKLNSGALKFKQKRQEYFKNFSERNNFIIANSSDKDIQNILKDSYLGGDKRINPPVNAIMDRKIIVDLPRTTENLVSSEVKDGTWFIFDYHVNYGYGQYGNNRSHCTVFLKIYDKRKFEQEMKILKRTIFDFMRPLNFNRINLNKLKIDKKGFNLKYRTYGEKVDKSAERLIDYLSENSQGLSAELSENICIVYTSLLGYNILEENKIEEIFLKLKEIL